MKWVYSILRTFIHEFIISNCIIVVRVKVDQSQSWDNWAWNTPCKGRKSISRQWTRVPNPIPGMFLWGSPIGISPIVCSINSR